MFFARNNITLGLLDKYNMMKLVVEECSLDVKMMKRLVLVGGKSNQYTKIVIFGDMGEHVVKVFTWSLAESLDNKAGLVRGKRAIGMKLGFIEPTGG
jgi:hypothetical protein